jgi:hypothetical protein
MTEEMWIGLLFDLGFGGRRLGDPLNPAGKIRQG